MAAPSRKVCSVTHTAVLVVDLVRDYFDPEIWPSSALPDLSTDVVAATNELTTAARTGNHAIFWIRQEFKPDLSDAFPHMIRDARRYAISGTDGCRLLPGLRTSKTDHDLVKTRFSAFFDTTLADKLRSLDVSRLYVAGVTTQWCVRSTVVDAYQQGFEVHVVRECTAAFTNESHRSALQEMDGYVAHVASLREATTSLRSSGSSCPEG